MNSVHGTNKRAEKRQRRHDEILATALQIVVDDGLAALSVHEIARRLDCAVGGLYRYFANKEAILVGLQDHAVERFSAHLEAETTGDGLERVLSAFFAWHSFAEVEPALYSLLDGALSDPARQLSDDAARVVEGRLRELMTRCAMPLQRAQDQGLLSPGDARLRAYSLFAAMHGVEHFRKRDSYSEIQSADVRQDLLIGMLRGWGAAV